MKRQKSSTVGRPRGFDPEVALERAMQVFWRKGYAATSVADLTAAMGINPPSLYAAFGNKEALFRKVLERYAAGPGAFVAESLSASTAREVAARRLYGALEYMGDPARPWGCLVVQMLLSGGGDAEALRRELVANGCRAQEELVARFERAKAEGDLPAEADAEALARFVTTLMQGLSVQVAAGVDREELRRVVDAALADWPKAPRKSARAAAVRKRAR
jgi:AcrR family transcriptional regulator